MTVHVPSIVLSMICKNTFLNKSLILFNSPGPGEGQDTRYKFIQGRQFFLNLGSRHKIFRKEVYFNHFHNPHFQGSTLIFITLFITLAMDSFPLPCCSSLGFWSDRGQNSGSMGCWLLPRYIFFGPLEYIAASCATRQCRCFLWYTKIYF